MIVNKVYRYPGLSSFDTTQDEVFHGRYNEKIYLFQFINSEKHVVLFAKSGIGKSSLINAGLVPILVNNNYLPIKLRFQYFSDEKEKQDVSFSPLSILKDSLKYYYKPDNVPDEYITYLNSSEDYREYRYQDNLWEYLKLCTIPLNKTLILIFDQFEELFNFSTDSRREFGIQVSEILADNPPKRVLSWLQDTPIEKRTSEMFDWATQPNIKLLFAIRSDRLYLMDELSKYIPTLLRNRFQLKPLDKNKAKEAIQKPCGADGESYLSPLFTINDSQTDKIIEHLGNRQDEIEAPFLQIICSDLEKKIIEKNNNITDGISKVFDDVIEEHVKENRLDNILQKYYLDKIDNISDDIVVRNEFRKLVEDELIFDESRVPINKNVLIDKIERTAFKNRPNSKEKAEELLKKSIDVFLLRVEPYSLGAACEISHDCLVEPIMKVKKERETLESQKIKEKKNQKLRWLIIFTVGLLFISFIAIFKLLSIVKNIKNTVTENNISRAKEFHEIGNNRLAYYLLAKAAEDNNEEAKKLLKSLDFNVLFGEKIIIKGDTLAYVLNKKRLHKHLLNSPISDDSIITNDAIRFSVNGDASIVSFIKDSTVFCQLNGKITDSVKLGFVKIDTKFDVDCGTFGSKERGMLLLSKRNGSNPATYEYYKINNKGKIDKTLKISSNILSENPVSPNNRYIILFEDNSLKIYDTYSDKISIIRKFKQVKSIKNKFSNDSNWLISKISGEGIEDFFLIYDIKNKTNTPLPNKCIEDFIFDGVKNIIFFCNKDLSYFSYDLITKQLNKSIKVVQNSSINTNYYEWRNGFLGQKPRNNNGIRTQSDYGIIVDTTNQLIGGDIWKNPNSENYLFLKKKDFIQIYSLPFFILKKEENFSDQIERWKDPNQSLHILATEKNTALYAPLKRKIFLNFDSGKKDTIIIKNNQYLFLLKITNKFLFYRYTLNINREQERVYKIFFFDRGLKNLFKPLSENEKKKLNISIFD